MAEARFGFLFFVFAPQWWLQIVVVTVCECVFIPVSCSAALSSAGAVAIIAGNNSEFGLQVINHVTSLLAVSCCCRKKIESKKKNNNEELQSNRDNKMNQDVSRFPFFFSLVPIYCYVFTKPWAMTSGSEFLCGESCSLGGKRSSQLFIELHRGSGQNTENIRGVQLVHLAIYSGSSHQVVLIMPRLLRPEKLPHKAVSVSPVSQSR